MSQQAIESDQGTAVGAASDPAEIAGKSGSSFYWPMLLLPRPKRQAMFAIYGFCRVIDDIADEPGDADAKHRELQCWRDEIRSIYTTGQGTGELGRALATAIRTYDLPRTEFDALIDGMAMDIPSADHPAGDALAPDRETLRLYCRRVAGAVGLLAIRVFDRADHETEAFALALGEALQLTNILRDLDEDAAIGRLYLPRQSLIAAGVLIPGQPIGDPRLLLSHRNLDLACEAVTREAAGLFDEAARLAISIDRRGLWTARAMMILYRRLLDRMQRRGWRNPPFPRPRLGKRERVWVTVRCMLGIPPHC